MTISLQQQEVSNLFTVGDWNPQAGLKEKSPEIGKSERLSKNAVLLAPATPKPCSNPHIDLYAPVLRAALAPLGLRDTTFLDSLSEVLSITS